MDKEAGTRKRITLTLDEVVHAQGKLLAADDGRDFSHYVEFLVKQDKARKALKDAVAQEVASAGKAQEDAA
jgi:hypothetical protein